MLLRDLDSTADKPLSTDQSSQLYSKNYYNFKPLSFQDDLGFWQNRSGSKAVTPATARANLASAGLASGQTAFSDAPTAISATEGSTSDFLGDRFATAYNIGNVSGRYTFTWNDSVSRTDVSDYFKFSLSNTTTFNLTLSNLSTDADVRLLNSNGAEITRSQNSGTNNESINRQLVAGSYYIQIYPYNNVTTNYRLGFTTSGGDSDPGSAWNTARDFGEVSRSFRFRDDFVGSSDVRDFYRFELRESTTLNITLRGLSADADLRLLDISRAEITRSVTSGSANETINRVLNPGIYYIEVYRFSTANTNYTVRLDGSQYFNSNPYFNSTYGYGLVNAAAAVARSINQNPFSNVANLGGLSWGNDMVNAPEAWARGYTGQGVTVAVIDSGVDINHADLRNNIWRNTREIANNGVDDDRNGYIDDVFGWNFGIGQNNNNVLPGTAYNDHGTHVAGTIAALRNNVGMTGIAPNARIMAIRLGNVSSEGYFTNAGSLPTAVRYAVNNGARVINMSLGWGDSAELRDTLAYATSRNVIVVSSAGNNQVQSPGNPSLYAINYGFAVGAIDISRDIADFSNLAGTDSRMRYVSAPGVGVYSTLPSNLYGFKDGTSMAAPHVAGVVALMLSANPNLTHTQVRQILIDTATYLS
jgi:hypothetical protein